MIKYRRGQGALSFFKQLCQRAGSVFPAAFKIAMPTAAVTAGLTIWIQYGDLKFLEDEHSVLRDNAAWGGFSFLVGFLIVFRTSASYGRFWDGCTSTHHMRAEWFDGCSSLLAFCKHSKESHEKILEFQNTLVRLFSMLHAAALAEIEDCAGEKVSDYEAFNFALIDADGIDEKSLLVIKSSSAKVELIFQWIQQLVVENINTGVLSIPPPILSRSFQEIANGMVAFHDAMKISYIPFPFPYAQTCDFLLLLHWIVVPFVVCQWVTEPAWAAVFSFIQVFILWALNFIAVELENPFGADANDIDGWHMQEEMNEHLILLMSPSTKLTPQLSSKYKDLSEPCYWNGEEDTKELFAHKSFSAVWEELDLALKPPARRSKAASKLGAISHQSRVSRVTSLRPTQFDTLHGSGDPKRLSTSSPEGDEVTKQYSLWSTAHDQNLRDASSVEHQWKQDAANAMVAAKTKSEKKTQFDDDETPDEPAPLQLQKVHVLNNENFKSPDKGGSFFRTEGDRMQQGEVREDTMGSEGPTTAPQSVQGMREDTNISSRNGADSTNLASSAASRGGHRKAGDLTPLLQENQPIGRASHPHASYPVVGSEPLPQRHVVTERGMTGSVPRPRS